jgi:hypothetical protein
MNCEICNKNNQTIKVFYIGRIAFNGCRECFDDQQDKNSKLNVGMPREVQIFIPEWNSLKRIQA